MYQNCIGWVYDCFKCVGLLQSLFWGKWCLILVGMSWVVLYLQLMIEQEVSYFVCDFNGVKFSKLVDVVVLDLQLELIEDDEFVRSSLDDCLE